MQNLTAVRHIAIFSGEFIKAISRALENARRLAQIAMLHDDPISKVPSSVPYRKVRAVWALWRIRNDIGSESRKLLVLRSIGPLINSVVLYFSVLSTESDLMIFDIIAVSIAMLALFIQVYGLYWILAPSEMYDSQNERIRDKEREIERLKSVSGRSEVSDYALTDIGNSESMVLENLRSATARREKYRGLIEAREQQTCAQDVDGRKDAMQGLPASEAHGRSEFEV